MAGDASYVIQTGAPARERPELIARLFWPTTETFLTRHDALEVDRFLDVRCGIGDVASRVVYARCVLTHQSDPRAGLAGMLTAARPGGRVLVEDVQVAAVWSSPPSEALARHLELYVAAAHGLGACPDAGCELAGMLHELGASDVRVDLVQPMLRVPEDIQVHVRTMEAVAAPVIEQGLAMEAEVGQLVTKLDEFANTPGAVAARPRVIQVSGRAPS
jgi:hypothetical protein